ncbi:MAG: hypothetical protein RL684_1732 [Pseudomonadota bacterium]
MRPGSGSAEAALRLKLLFTDEPLSVQVHPDDAFARSIGLPHGKAEAWYILAAERQARVALGLLEPVTPQSLRAAVLDGSIAGQLCWRPVAAGDAWYVAPGTIHTLGPGLVLLEVQQQSDATFRLFDYGRQRGLDADEGVAAASASQEAVQAPLHRLDAYRTVLVASPHFVLERIELPTATRWELNAMTETWIYALAGTARIDTLAAAPGDVFCMQAQTAVVDAQSGPWTGLVAYVGQAPPAALLRALA